MAHCGPSPDFTTYSLYYWSRKKVLATPPKQNDCTKTSASTVKILPIRLAIHFLLYAIENDDKQNKTKNKCKDNYVPISEDLNFVQYAFTI